MNLPFKLNNGVLVSVNRIFPRDPEFSILFENTWWIGNITFKG